MPLHAPGADAVPATPRSLGRSRQPAPALLAGAGAVLVAGVAALLMLGRSGTETAIAPASRGASAAASAAPGSAPANATAVVSTQETRPVAATAPPPRAAGSAGRKPVAAKAAAAPSTPPPGESMAPALEGSPATAQVREEVRSAPPSRTPATNPADACKDKMFLTREFCLAEQCEKPGARNHPLCVQRREDAKMREESKVRN